VLSHLRKEDVVKRVMKLTDGLGADKVIEAVGGIAPTAQQAVKMARRRGIVTIVGTFEKPIPSDLFSLMMKELEIRGCHSYTY